MMAHLQIKQGDDFTGTLTITDDGDAVNITGAALVWHLRAFGSDDDVLTVTMTILDASAGTATLTLTHTQTAALSTTTAYTYEVELTDALGNVSTPIYGRVYVRLDRG